MKKSNETRNKRCKKARIKREKSAPHHLDRRKTRK
jgi:hypothetical protein